jgi:ectoine hydroxylase-related dioxygenase (phytanoyl-CoA dioxygenase family)
MLNEVQRKQYLEEGYLILTDFFEPTEIDALTAEIDRLDQRTNERLRQTGQISIAIPDQIVFSINIHRRHQIIADFIKHPKLVELATAILGPDVRLYWDQSVYKRPEMMRDFPWHQDTGYIRTDPPNYLTCWLALGEANRQNGCIWVRPRSHLEGMLEHQKTAVGYQCYFGDEPGVPVELRKGSMAIFSAQMVHRSGPNLSDHIRKAYIIQYSVVGAKNMATGEEFENGPIVALNGKAV